MNWLRNNYGGHVQTSHRKDNYIYRWDLRSQSAVEFLKLIYPFIIIKKEQVELAIEYMEKKGKYLETLKGKSGFRTLTEEEIKWRYAMKEKLSKLKTKYILYNKNVGANND